MESAIQEKYYHRGQDLLRKQYINRQFPCEFHSSYFSSPIPLSKVDLESVDFQKTPLRQGRGGQIVCLQLKSLGRVIFLRVLSMIVAVLHKTQTNSHAPAEVCSNLSLHDLWLIYDLCKSFFLFPFMWN